MQGSKHVDCDWQINNNKERKKDLRAWETEGEESSKKH
jgi:hypothetical protein